MVKVKEVNDFYTLIVKLINEIQGSLIKFIKIYYFLIKFPKIKKYWFNIYT